MDDEYNERTTLLPGILHCPIDGDPVREVYRDYKKRWYILLAMAVCSISNGMLWISFAPIADVTGAFYGVSASQVNWLSLVFPVASVPLGFISIWVLDTFGLRIAINLAAWLNGVGALLRLISSQSFVPQENRFLILMLGQCIAAASQSVFMFSPTKIAALWFKDNQRALANTIGSMANPMGILVGNLLSPAIVKHTADLPLAMEVYAGPAVLGLLMTTFGICSALPPSPPSASAAEESQPFLVGLKAIWKVKSFWVLALCAGGGTAIFTTLTTLFEQMLCTRGYSDNFAGLCGALIIGCGAIGAAIGGVYVDRTKKFEEFSKVFYCLMVLAIVSFSVISRYRDQEALIAISVSLFGFFGVGMYPVSFEMGVECTYPIAEATSTGLIGILGQIMSILLILLMQVTSSDMNTPYQTCNSGGKSGIDPRDFTYPNIALSSIAVCLAMLFMSLFKCSYRRMEAEQQLASEKILNFRSSRSGSTQEDHRQI